MDVQHPGVLQDTIRQLRVVTSAGQVSLVVVLAGVEDETTHSEVLLPRRALRDPGSELLSSSHHDTCAGVEHPWPRRRFLQGDPQIGTVHAGDVHVRRLHCNVRGMM
ncbi:hypothetical protein CEXT_573111 [Caerostris extrusa]|uniref:Uncharacterized protein n=1 Tax=Caerostris extrusa TaxID=172846 RepID=A0AAV4WQ95_CAEEX|nr:hypothetical protein CEXT_573111 [Caerostris extrusa]